MLQSARLENSVSWCTEAYTYRSKTSLVDCKPTRSTPCITLQRSYSSSSQLPPPPRPRPAATAGHWASIMAEALLLLAGACHTRGTPCWCSSKASPGTQPVASPHGAKAKKTAADGEASDAATGTNRGVIAIQLRNTRQADDLNRHVWDTAMAGQISPSLLSLQHLEHLDHRAGRPCAGVPGPPKELELSEPLWHDIHRHGATPSRQSLKIAVP